MHANSHRPPARMPHQPWTHDGGCNASVGVTVRNPCAEKQISGSLVLARSPPQNDHHKGLKGRPPSPGAIKKRIAWGLPESGVANRRRPLKKQKLAADPNTRSGTTAGGSRGFDRSATPQVRFDMPLAGEAVDTRLIV